MRPAIHPPRDLAMPARFLRSALSLVDSINPFLAASQPADLVFEELDRKGQVAGFLASQAAMEDGMNARRRSAWRARFGGKDTYEGSARSATRAVLRSIYPGEPIGQQPFVLKSAGVSPVPGIKVAR